MRRHRHARLAIQKAHTSRHRSGHVGFAHWRIILGHPNVKPVNDPVSPVTFHEMHEVTLPEVLQQMITSNPGHPACLRLEDGRPSVTSRRREWRSVHANSKGTTERRRRQQIVQPSTIQRK